MRYVIRATALCLCLILCLSLFACATPETPEDPKDETPEDNLPGTPEDPADDPAEKPEDPEDDPAEKPEDPNLPPEKIDPGVPADGVAGTFHVLHYTTANHEWTNPWDEIVPATGMEIAPGDLIGDDIFDRAAWLEQEYGIVVTSEYMDYGKLPTLLPQIIKTGSTDYQLLDTMGRSAQKLMGNDYFLNIAELPYIDFEHPWWVPGALEALSLGDYVEFAVSDMLLIDKSATMVLFFNIPMAEKIGLDGLYDDVRGHEWTLERLAEYAELGFVPNGDDVMDADDVYGIVTNDDPVHMLYAAAGRKFMSKNEDGTFYYSYGEGDSFTVMMDLLNTIMYADFTWNSYLKPEAPVFADGGALFTFDKLKRCMSLRDMVDDYGILPLPMYDVDQAEYYGPVSNYHDSMFAVINTNQNNQETIGAALELMSYFSYYEIYSDFFEVVIQNRGTRDAESKEMLSIIFDNRSYDMGLIYDPHELTAKIIRITGTHTDGVVSQWENFGNLREDTIAKINALVDTYN